MKDLKAPHPEHYGEETKTERQHRLHCVHAPPGTDYAMLVNQMIKDAVSINWLYDIPPGVSMYTDEYPQEIKSLVAINPINLESILDGSELLLPGRFKFTVKPILTGTDGALYIPEFIVSTVKLETWPIMLQFYQYLINQNAWQPEQQQQQRKPAALPVKQAQSKPPTTRKRTTKQVPQQETKPKRAQPQTRRSQRLRQKS